MFRHPVRTLLHLASLGLLLACGSPPADVVVERNWEYLCGERCAGAPVQVEVGIGYSCVRYAGGAVLCWGIRRGVAADVDAYRHERGPVGFSDWPQIEMPEGIVAAADLQANLGHTCVIEGPTREERCWGTLTPPTVVPVRYGSDDVGSFGQFCALDTHGHPLDLGPSWEEYRLRDCAKSRRDFATQCGIDLEGRLYCAGHNSAGQVGNGLVRGDTGGNEPITHLPQLVDVVQVVTEEDFTCALEGDGEVWCWGDNFLGVVGREPMGWDPYTDNRSTYKFATPQRVEGLADIVKLASSSRTVCAVRADGQLFCWGEDWIGLMRLPSPDGLAPETTTPVAIVDAHDVVDLDMTTQHCCLIRRTGEVACWGSDYHCAIGPEPSYVPFGHLQPVRGLPSH